MFGATVCACVCGCFARSSEYGAYGSKRGCLKQSFGSASDMSLMLFTSDSNCDTSFWYDLIDRFCSFFTRSKSAKRSVRLARFTSVSAADNRFSVNQILFKHLESNYFQLNDFVGILPSASKSSSLMSLKLFSSSIMAFTSFNAFSTWAVDSSESDFACPTCDFE